MEKLIDAVRHSEFKHLIGFKKYMVSIEVEYRHNTMGFENGFRWFFCVVRGLLVNKF